MAFHLPEELIFEILLRLPVKSICRFTCVSKTWLHMISSPGAKSFKSLYDQRSRPRSYLVLENCSKLSEEEMNNRSYLQTPSSSESEDRFTVVDKVSGRVHSNFKLRLGTPQNHITLMQSCHGLILITLCLPMLKKHHYISNPSIREFKSLPNLPFGRQIHAAGLGYLPSKNQYKIVAWFVGVSIDDDYFRKTGCSILAITNGGEKDSGSGGGWREISIAELPCVPLRTMEKNKLPECVKGVLYWWAWHGNREAIVAFDLEKEEFRMIPCPPPSRWVEMRGELCCSRLNDSNLMFHILALRNNVWEQIHEIDTRTIMPSPVRLLAHVTADDDDEQFVLLTEEQGIVYYNLKTRSYKVPEHLANIRFLGSSALPSSFVHVSSFVCVDSFFSLEGL